MIDYKYLKFKESFICRKIIFKIPRCFRKNCKMSRLFNSMQTRGSTDERINCRGEAQNPRCNNWRHHHVKIRLIHVVATPDNYNGFYTLTFFHHHRLLYLIRKTGRSGSTTFVKGFIVLHLSAFWNLLGNSSILMKITGWSIFWQRSDTSSCNGYIQASKAMPILN